jgi:FkbM family methyltransferase
MLRRLKELAAGHLPNRVQFRIRRLLAPFGHAEPELALVGLLARPDRAFLDIGANKGVYVMAAAGRFAAVYAVEPNPQMAAYLRDCLGGVCTVLECALSDRRGSLPLWVPARGSQAITSLGSLEAGANPGLAQTSVTVPVERLDDLSLPPLALVKIDVEGHERAMLEGGIARLERDRPALIVEIEERHHPGRSDEVVARLADLGYEAFYLEGGSLRPLAGASIAALQAAGPPPPGHPRRSYINNFVFLHHGEAARRAALRNAGHHV